MNIIKEYNQSFTSEMLNDAIFVIDNNCLLFPLKDYMIGNHMIEAFMEIKDNVYIPYVTQIEYLENERVVIGTRKKNLSSAKQAWEDIKNVTSILDIDLKDRIANKIFNNFSSSNRNNDDMKSMHRSIDKIKEDYIRDMQDYLQKSENRLREIDEHLIEEKNKMLQNTKQTFLEDVDDIKSKLLNFIHSVNLGSEYDCNVLDKYELEIAKRFEVEISPGYKDFDAKSDKIIKLSGKALNRSYSDAIFWLDALNYAKNKKDKKYLVVISNEKKEDWVAENNANKINIDMISECYRKTGMIAKKIDIWTLLDITETADEDSINKSRETFDNSMYNFILYGQEYTAGNQARMMEIIFEKIISNIEVDDSLLSIPCILAAEDEQWEENKNTTFDSYILVSDKSRKRYAIATRLNLKQKLRYIFDLLDKRVKGSAPQLKFIDQELQNSWEQVCYQREQ